MKDVATFYQVISMMGILVTIIIAFLTFFSRQLTTMKNGFSSDLLGIKSTVDEQLRCFKSAIKEKADKEAVVLMRIDNETSHEVIHHKIENHYHNDKGHVVLRPTGGE